MAWLWVFPVFPPQFHQQDSWGFSGISVRNVFLLVIINCILMCLILFLELSIGCRSFLWISGIAFFDIFGGLIHLTYYCNINQIRPNRTWKLSDGTPHLAIWRSHPHLVSDVEVAALFDSHWLHAITGKSCTGPIYDIPRTSRGPAYAFPQAGPRETTSTFNSRCVEVTENVKLSASVFARRCFFMLIQTLKNPKADVLHLVLYDHRLSDRYTCYINRSTLSAFTFHRKSSDPRWVELIIPIPQWIWRAQLWTVRRCEHQTRGNVMKKNDGKNLWKASKIRVIHRSLTWWLITDDFLPDVSRDFTGFDVVPKSYFLWMVWLLRVASRDSHEITTHKLQSSLFLQETLPKGYYKYNPSSRVVQDND